MYFYQDTTESNCPSTFLPIYPSTQELEHGYQDVSELSSHIWHVAALNTWQLLFFCSFFGVWLSSFVSIFLLFPYYDRDYFFSPCASIAQKQRCHPLDASDISGSSARHCRNRAYPRYAGAPMYCSEEPDYFLFHAAFFIHSAVPRVGERRKW